VYSEIVNRGKAKSRGLSTDNIEPRILTYVTYYFKNLLVTVPDSVPACKQLLSTANVWIKLYISYNLLIKKVNPVMRTVFIKQT
jgi:hypothetical protein